MKKIKLSWLLLILCLCSCSNEEIFYEFHSFEKGEWTREEPAVFTLNVTDTLSYYTLDLVLRNDDSYAYQNIWLFIDRKNPEGEIRSDSLNVELADVYGKWHGKGLSLYSLSIPYLSSLRYDSGGDYTYTIRQGMRENPLKGVSDIGLKLSKQTAQ